MDSESNNKKRVLACLLIQCENNIINMNKAIQQYNDDSDDEELEMYIKIMKYGEKPTRIENYVEHVVSGYMEIEFKSHFRLNRQSFENLLEIIGPRLCHEEDSNTIKKQILAVIWLLATPDSYRSVGERFDMAKSSLSVAFIKVVDEINNIANQIIVWPDLLQQKRIEEAFCKLSGMRTVIGAIEGTYIRIDGPKKYQNEYINRKMFHSITLQAICDNDLKFIDVFAGYPSSVNDCRIFRNSDIYKDVNEDIHKFFPNNYFIIGDKAYPTLKWCLVPFKDYGTLSDILNFELLCKIKRKILL